MSYIVENLENHLYFKSTIVDWYYAQWGDKHPQRSKQEWNDFVYAEKTQFPITFVG